MTLGEIMAVYLGDDGEATKRLYMRLHEYGAAGFIAVNLFRALKCSERAKLYRGHAYKSAAYDRKQWSINNLAKALQTHATSLGIVWGWREDHEQRKHNQAIYIDLPDIGQVSFHTAHRSDGPEHPTGWSGERGQGPTRVCRYVERVLNAEAKAA